MTKGDITYQQLTETMTTQSEIPIHLQSVEAIMAASVVALKTVSVGGTYTHREHPHLTAKIYRIANNHVSIDGYDTDSTGWSCTTGCEDLHILDFIRMYEVGQ